MQILNLNFKKDKNRKTILTDKDNLDNLNKWILPVIVGNEGWGTGELTFEEFHKNPKKFQDHIDATVWDNVHVFLDESGAVGILEFTKSNLGDFQKRGTNF